MARKKRKNRPSTGKRGGKTRTSWKPGQSGNPRGRPKNDNRLKARCQRLTPLMLRELKWVATLRPNGSQIVLGSKVRAAELIMAYGHGRPTERHEHTGDQGGPILLDLSMLSDKALAEWEKAVRGGKEKQKEDEQ